MNQWKIFLVLLPFYTFSVFAKTIVISDIDDTLKKANSTGSVSNIYYFLLKKPYIEMRDLFLEIKKNEEKNSNPTDFYYVSAALQITFDADEWLSKNHFPAGKSYLKTLQNHAATYEFKYNTIKEILKNEDLKNTHILMFGDNAQVDQVVYTNLKKELNLDADIFIRDVGAEATYFDSSLEVKKIPGVNYYFSEAELLNNASFYFLSDALKNKIITNYHNQKLIPLYTLTTLEHRIRSLCQEITAVCKREAKSEAEKYWLDYYSRY